VSGASRGGRVLLVLLGLVLAVNAQFRFNMGGGGGFGGGGGRQRQQVAVPEIEEIDLYEIMGLDEDATDKEIKKAFRKLSLKYHPDKNQGDGEAADKFREITDAYEILSDEKKKFQYDFGGMKAVKEGEKPDQMDFFGGLFGGGQRDSKKGGDANMESAVTLEQLYNGAVSKASIERRVVCRGCAGKKGKKKEKCKACGRCPNEVKMVQRQMGPGFMVQQQEEVPSKEKCKNEKKVLEIVVEKGMPDGAQLRFEYASEQKPGQVPGDVIISLKQKKHPRFERKGDHLHHSMKISLKQALTGFSATILHLDGRTVDVSNKGITRPFQTVVVRGEGMPVHEVPSQFGDMHVTYEVEFPRELNAQQIATLRDLL